MSGDGHTTKLFIVQGGTIFSSKDGVFQLFFTSLCEFVISADFYLFTAFATGKQRFLLCNKSHWLWAKHSDKNHSLSDSSLSTFILLHIKTPPKEPFEMLLDRIFNSECQSISKSKCYQNKPSIFFYLVAQYKPIISHADS